MEDLPDALSDRRIVLPFGATGIFVELTQENSPSSLGCTMTTDDGDNYSGEDIGPPYSPDSSDPSLESLN